MKTITQIHQELNAAGDFMTCADPRGWIRISNRLLDACLDAGMDPDEEDHLEWAAGWSVDCEAIHNQKEA